jgi:PKD repeat protein
LMFLPVKHKFIRSSWDAAGRGPDANIGSLIHFIVSNNDCSQGSALPMVIGIIDTFAINNGEGNRDTLFCQDEAVYFVDSIRYWRGDCSVTQLPLNPALSLSPAYFGFLGASPFNTYQFDSADFWRQDFGDPRVIQNIIRTVPNFIKWNALKAAYDTLFLKDTVVPEKVYWNFGDGSPIDSTLRPVHRYKTFGRFTVTMVTKDSLRGFDTCIGYVNVSVPVAKIGFALDGSGLPKDMFNCGDFTDMIDSSHMDPSTTAGSLDSVKTNYWWFGENKIDTVMWQTKNQFFPKWPYRNNGSFRVKLVSESYLGCKDTTYDTVFVRGPRPAFKVLIDSDTIGCAPFTVKLWNLADSLGKYVDANGNTNPADTPTLTTYFDWGDGVSPQTIVYGRRDTVTFTYTKAGDYKIFAIGSDAEAGKPNSCEFVSYPDTPNAPSITIHVLDLKREVLTDKDVVCIVKSKDTTAVSSPVTITNNSDPQYYGDYNYFIQRKFDSTNVDTILRTLMLDNFP